MGSSFCEEHQIGQFLQLASPGCFFGDVPVGGNHRCFFVITLAVLHTLKIMFNNDATKSGTMRRA